MFQLFLSAILLFHTCTLHAFEHAELYLNEVNNVHNLPIMIFANRYFFGHVADLKVVDVVRRYSAGDS